MLSQIRNLKKNTLVSDYKKKLGAFFQQTQHSIRYLTFVLCISTMSTSLTRENKRLNFCGMAVCPSFCFGSMCF